MKKDKVDIIIESLLNEAEQISKYKQQFIDYCKGRVKDLGEMAIALDEDDPTELDSFEILYTSKMYKQSQPLAYILNNEDGYLMVANDEGEVFVNSPMSSPEVDIVELTFHEISTNFYEYILEYWDEQGMDDMMEEYQADKSNEEKANTELVVPEPFKYYTNGGSVEVYCDKYPDLKARTTTMRGTEYVQEHFDINGLWEVNIIDENGKWKERGYADGWQEAMNMLKQQYDACTAPTPKSTVTTPKGTFTTEEYNAKEDEVKEAYKKVLQNEMSEEEYNAIVEDALKMLHKNDIESAEFWAKHDLGLVKTVSEMEAEQKSKKSEAKSDVDKAIEDELKLADKVEKYLADNYFYPADVFAAGTRVMVEIKDGHWKHAHRFCDVVMDEIGYTLVEEEVTKDNGRDDYYSAIRHYESKDAEPEEDDTELEEDTKTEGKEIDFWTDGKSYSAYVAPIELDLNTLPEDVEYSAVVKLPKTKAKMFMTTRPLTDEERKQYNIRINTAECKPEEIMELFTSKPEDDVSEGEEMKTENVNNDITALKAKVEDYITDDYHREEDFTDIEVSEETMPYMLEMVRAKLDALSDEDIITMAKEIDARDIDLMAWGNEAHSATKAILDRMEKELSEVEDEEDYDELDESKSHNTTSDEFEMNCKAWRTHLDETAEFIKEFGDDDVLMTLEELGNNVSKELANIGFQMGFAPYHFTRTTDLEVAKNEMADLVENNIDDSELEGLTVKDILREIGGINKVEESLSSYDYIKQQAMMQRSQVTGFVNFLNDLGISDDAEDIQINEEVIIDYLSRKGLTMAKTENGYDIKDGAGKIGSMSYSTEIGKWIADNKVTESIETKLAELELGANIEVPSENGVSFKIYRDEDEAHKDMYAIYTYKDGEVQEELDTGDVHISDIEDKLAELKSKLTESFDNCICPQCMEEITKLIPVETRDLAPEELDQLDGNEEDIIFFECPECGYRDKKEMFCESKLTESKTLTEAKHKAGSKTEFYWNNDFTMTKLRDGLKSGDIKNNIDICTIEDKPNKVSAFVGLYDYSDKGDFWLTLNKHWKNTDKQDEFENIDAIDLDKEAVIDMTEEKFKSYIEYKFKELIKNNKSELTEAEEVSGTIKEQLNTGLLPIVDVDMYSLSDALYNIDVTQEELDDLVQELAPIYVKEAIQKVLPSAEVYVTGVYHPKQYNFSGDELEFDLVVSAQEYNALKEKVENEEAFIPFLKDNYSSQSGFVSFLADNIDDYRTQDNWKQMVQVIMYALKQADVKMPDEGYTVEFLDEVASRFPEVDREAEDLEESKSYTDEEIKQAIDADLKAHGGYFTDDSAYDVVERLTGIKEVDKVPQDLVVRIRTLVKGLDNWKEDNSINESATVEEKEMTAEEIKARIAEINKQLAYIRRRDRVSLAFGSEQEQYELNQEREQLRAQLKKAKKTEATHKYVSLEDMCNDLGKEIVKHDKVLSSDTGIENVFNFSDKNGGAVDSHRYYNDYVVVDKRPDKKTEATQDYSDPYKVAGKWFRYNYKYSEVEYITHASNEFGPIEVITSVGLSKDNWENKEARNEYLQGWAEELDAEANSLADDFIKNELPYLTESYDYSKHTTKEIIDRLLQIDPDKLFNIDMEELEIMVANKETNETGVAVPMMSGEGLFVYEGNPSGEDDKEYSIEEFDKAHVITGIKAWDVKAGKQVDINIFDDEFINGTKWSEETEEPNDNIIDQINDMEYKGIWVRYVAETNTVQFIVDQDKADKLQLEDTVVDTIHFRNQTPKEIKHHIDTELDKSLLTD